MYLERFVLPIDIENSILAERAMQNGGVKFGYVDNQYPCGLFPTKGLREII